MEFTIINTNYTIFVDKLMDISNKFNSQNEELKQLLLGTGTKMLIEAAVDKTWGIGCVEFGDEGAKNKETGEWNIKPEDWKGSNLLGRCLMDVREEIIYSTS